LKAVQILLTDPMTGRRTELAEAARKALQAMNAAKIPYCVVGAAALAARGLPRMTGAIDLAVMSDGASQARVALHGASKVDLRVAAGDPEATAIDDAELATLFALEAPIATLEHLLLLYLYSNQPKHLGDFASIVQSQRADLSRAERALSAMHPEMLPEWKRRVDQAKNPPPSPQKPRAADRRKPK
jgi:hypothetical protein